MYDPTRYVEKEVPKTVKAVVVEIKSGTLGELVGVDALKKWKNADENSAAIQITAETEEGSSRRRILQLPATDEISPQSNLAKWKRAYGAFPFEGQTIELDADEDGWYQFRV